MPKRVIYQATVEYLQILDENGVLDEELARDTLSDQDVLQLYETMAVCREVDEQAFRLQRSGRMGTFPQNKGQEAVAIGAARALRKGIDWMVPDYRNNAAMIHHGLPMHQVLLHWMGDERGNVIPKELAMNPICVVVGAQPLHAVGIAWAFKLTKQDRAVLGFLGDGATSTGDFHEAMNFASVMHVPVVLCCSNNKWAISVPCSRQTASETFAQKAIAYGMPTIRVDGNDLFAVYKAHRDALERARRGEGPSFIEAVTYRLADHTTADDARRYRPDEELEAARKADPMIRLRKYLTNKKLWDDQKQGELETRVRRIAREVAETAINVQKPEVEDMFRYLYGELPEELQTQMRTMRTDSLGQNPEQVGLNSETSFNQQVLSSK